MAQGQDLCAAGSRGACLAEVPFSVGVLVGWWQAWDVLSVSPWEVTEPLGQAAQGGPG